MINPQQHIDCFKNAGGELSEFCNSSAFLHLVTHSLTLNLPNFVILTLSAAEGEGRAVPLH
jgi:hypothetical protein